MVSPYSAKRSSGGTGDHLGNSARLPEIEVLRAIAVLMVLFLHLPSLMPGMYPWWLDGGWLHRVNLAVGVDIFFCVSGFVVARVLLRELAGMPLGKSAKLVGRFWIRRAFRLWPSAWLWLVAAYLCSVWFNRAGFMDKAANLRLLPAGVGMYADFLVTRLSRLNRNLGTMGQYWSLSLEEQFYFVLPILLILAQRLTLPILVAGVVTWWSADVEFWTANFFRPGCIVAGVFLSIIEGGAVWRWMSKWRSLRLRTGLYLSLCCAAAWVNSIGVWDTILGIPAAPLKPCLVTLVCFFIVAVAATQPAVSSVSPIKALLIFIGGRSYLLYLIHPLAFALALEILYRIDPRGAGGVLHAGCLVGLALVVLILATETTSRWIERPLRQLGRRLTQAEHAAAWKQDDVAAG